MADPLDACPVLWKVIPAMMAPVIGTDADVDGSDQAAYLRYSHVPHVGRTVAEPSPAPPSLLAVHLIVLVAIRWVTALA